MRIVYAGPMSGTCLSRLNALRSMEQDVVAFNSEPFFKGRSILERIDRVLTQRTAQFARANAGLLELCASVRPEIVWVDKGYWIWPRTLRALKEQGVFLAEHNTDALHPARWFLRRSYRLLNSTLELYDLYFTSNLRDYAAMSRRAGGPRCELTYLGFDHERFNDAPLPPDLARQWENDLIFVGHHEPHTESGILALLAAGLRVRVFGRGWRRARNRARLADVVTFRELDDNDYVSALKGAKIGLCFFSKLNGNETSGRSFEIPACGTFLLAMRSRQHSECFEEGRDAEFFDSEQELVEKARYYLAHEDKRREVARRGRERVVRSDYSWARFMRDDWNKTLAAFHLRAGPR